MIDPNNPKNPANRFAWNRRGNTRRDLEAFLTLAEARVEAGDTGDSPLSKANTRRVLAFLRTLMDRSPQDLFDASTTTQKDSNQS